MTTKAPFPGHPANAALAIKGMALALVLGVATSAKADPLSTYDEGMSALLVSQECKADFPKVFSQPSASVEPKLRSMGDAAWHQLWDALDEQDSTHHDENARKADFELKQRSVADLAHVRALIATQGCDSLVPHAREVLESYLR